MASTSQTKTSLIINKAKQAIREAASAREPSAAEKHRAKKSKSPALTAEIIARLDQELESVPQPRKLGKKANRFAEGHADPSLTTFPRKLGKKAAAVAAQATVRKPNKEEKAMLAGVSADATAAGPSAYISTTTRQVPDLGMDLGKRAYSEREYVHMCEFVTLLRAYNKKHPKEKAAVTALANKRFILSVPGKKDSEPKFAPTFLAIVTQFISKASK